MSWAALLRGVNVGGARKLPMAEPRAFLARQGCPRVARLILGERLQNRTGGAKEARDARDGSASRC